MALLTVRIAHQAQYTAAVVIDGDSAGNGTGEIQSGQWTITPSYLGTGAIEATISQDGKAPLTVRVTTSGATPVPAGYFLTWNPKGAWVWGDGMNGLTFSSTWIPN